MVVIDNNKGRNVYNGRIRMNSLGKKDLEKYLKEKKEKARMEMNEFPLSQGPTPSSYYGSAEERYAKLAMTRQEQIKLGEDIALAAMKRHMKDNVERAPYREWKADPSLRAHSHLQTPSSPGEFFHIETRVDRETL